MTTTFEVTVRGESYDQISGRITREGQQLFGNLPFIVRDIRIVPGTNVGIFRATATVELLEVGGRA